MIGWKSRLSEVNQINVINKRMDEWLTKQWMGT